MRKSYAITSYFQNGTILFLFLLKYKRMHANVIKKIMNASISIYINKFKAPIVEKNIY